MDLNTSRRGHILRHISGVHFPHSGTSLWCSEGGSLHFRTLAQTCTGAAGGGKSCCYQVLQSALGELHAQDLPGFKPVQTHVLNPKCISLGELYGAYNPTTNEWSDGLASSIIRTAVADEQQQWHWVVFDGPVDALWIESMNTGGYCGHILGVQSDLCVCEIGWLLQPCISGYRHACPSRV